MTTKPFTATVEIDVDTIRNLLCCAFEGGDMLAENDDATTGDVFLQCALFGELVFG